MRNRRSIRALSALLTAAAFTFVAPSTLDAQTAVSPAVKEAARHLTKEGMDRHKAGKYDEAIDLFRQADKLHHAPTIVLREARAHEKKGDLLTARDRYRDVVNEPLDSKSPKQYHTAQSEAKNELQALEKRIPKVRLILRGVTKDARVSIDGKEVPPTSLQAPLEQNPGTYTIAASATGAKSVTREITLAEKDNVDVDLELPADPPVVVPPPTPVVTAPVASPPRAPTKPLIKPARIEEDAGGSSMPASAMIAFGAGAVGLGVGVVAGALWLSQDSSLKEQCSMGGDDPYICPGGLAEDIDSTKTMGKVAVAGLVMAGVGASLGVVFLATSPSGSSTALSVGPGSITLRGAF